MIRASDLKILPRRKCPLAFPINDILEVRPYIPAMIAYVRNRGYGYLTMPQIGVGKTAFITYIKGDYARIFINPSLITYGKLLEERRREHVTVHALNLKGEQFIINTESGYYEDRLDVGERMAAAIQEAYFIIE